jgi:hypothetical protein
MKSFSSLSLKFFREKNKSHFLIGKINSRNRCFFFSKQFAATLKIPVRKGTQIPLPPQKPPFCFCFFSEDTMGQAGFGARSVGRLYLSGR